MSQVQFTNLFQDPTFSLSINDTNSKPWRLYNATLEDKTNGTMAMIQSVNSTNFCWLEYYPPIDIQLYAGHLYYVSWEEKIELPNPTSWQNNTGFALVWFYAGGTGSSINKYMTLFQPEDGWIKHRMFLRQESNVTRTLLRLGLSSIKDISGNSITIEAGSIKRYIREPMLIDITQSFPTIDIEPTVNWCANHLPFFSGSLDVDILP